MKKKESEWIVEDLIKKGVINIMNVAHDNDCDKIKDNSALCSCNPDITMGQVKEK